MEGLAGYIPFRISNDQRKTGGRPVGLLQTPLPGSGMDDYMNKLRPRLKKIIGAVLGIYTFYAVWLLATQSAQFPLMPYGILFAAGLAALVLYGSHLLKNESRGRIVGGLQFIYTLNRYEFLIEQLVSRDFKTKYKRSVLGVLWSFLNPLLLMTVQYVVFSNLMRFEIEHYAAYLLCGIVIFNGFQDCANQSMHSITGNSTLITKVYVPKYIYPCSKVFSAGINTVLSMIPLLIVSMFSGVYPSFSWFLIPIGLLFILIFTVGVGFLLSSVVVFFRDIEFLWGVFTTLWMYATPIIYDISILPDWMQKLEIINPMYHLISFMRTIVIGGQSPEPAAYLICLGIGLATVLLGGFVFKKTQDQFILYL